MNTKRILGYLALLAGAVILVYGIYRVKETKEAIADKTEYVPEKSLEEGIAQEEPPQKDDEYTISTILNNGEHEMVSGVETLTPYLSSYEGLNSIEEEKKALEESAPQLSADLNSDAVDIQTLADTAIKLHAIWNQTMPELISREKAVRLEAIQNWPEREIYPEAVETKIRELETEAETQLAHIRIKANETAQTIFQLFNNLQATIQPIALELLSTMTNNPEWESSEDLKNNIIAKQTDLNSLNASLQQLVAYMQAHQQAFEEAHQQ